MQNDGTIVTAGYVVTGGTFDFALARYTGTTFATIADADGLGTIVNND